MNDSKRSFWLTPNGLAAIGLIGAVWYFLLTEHRAHFISGLPFLILLLCPVMHIFMHRGRRPLSDRLAELIGWSARHWL